MRIRNLLFRNSLYIVILLALAIAGQFVFYSLQNKELQIKANSDQIAREVAGLILLTNEWSTFHYQRIYKQWEIKNKQVKELVNQNKAEYHVLQVNLNALENSFRELMKTSRGLQKDIPISESRLLTEKQEWLVTQNQVASQAIIDKTFEISENAMHNLERFQQIRSLLFVGFLLLISLILFISSSRLTRRITKPLELLQQKIQKFEKGNYSESLNLDVEGSTLRNKSDTYILAGAINSMLATIRENLLKLKQQNTYIQTILDNVPLGVAVNKLDEGDATYMNNQFEKIYGWPKDELSDLANFFKRVYPDENYRKEIQGRIMKDIETGDSSKMHWEDIEVTTQTGEKRIVNVQNIPLVQQNLMVSTVQDVTKKKQAEEALRKSEQRFRMVFEAANVGKSITLPSGEINVNQAFADMLGYSGEELQHKKWQEITPTEEVPEIEEKLKPILEGKAESLRFEKGYIHKNGSQIWADVSVRLMRNSENKPLYFITTIVDISEKKKVSNEQLRLLNIIEKSRNEIFVFDEDSLNFEFVNQGALENLGFSLEEMNRMTPLDIKPEITENQFREMLNLLKDGSKERLVFETLHQRKNGTTYPVEIYLQLQKSDDNNVFLAVINDITERKQAEETLRESEERFRVAQDFSPGGFTILHPLRTEKNEIVDFTWIYENKTIARINKTDPEDVKNKQLLDLFPAHKGTSVFETYLEVANSGKPKILEEVYVGEVVSVPTWLRLVVVPMEEDIAVLTQDITERKKNEEKIKQNEARLQSLVNVFQHQTEGLQEFLDYALNEAIKLTGSKIGYIYFYSEEKKEFTLNTWSDRVMDVCSVIEPQTVYQLEKTGIWGEAVRQRKEIVVNDFQAPNLLRKGLPEGHAPLFKYMTIPVFSDNKIVAVLGLANKENDYEKVDVLQVQILMDTLWKEVERKRGEKMLIESEERKRSYFEQAPYGIFIANNEGKYVEVNPGACELTGYTEKELLKKRIPDILHADDLKNGLKHVEEIQKSGKAYGEFRYHTKAGIVRWWSVAATKLPDNLLLGFCEDITERKEAEQALSNSHDLMKYIIEHNQSSVAVLDRNLKYLYVSQRFLSEYRVKEKNIIGKHHYEVFPEIPEKWRKIHQKALKGIVSRADEDKFYRSDGTFDWTRWECHPWYEADDLIGGIILYLEVISEQKQKELEIKKLNERLEILIGSVQQLDAALSLDSVQDIVAKSARKLIGADGATLVFREDDNCFYVNEDAIQPLWKGKKIPMHSCISGWVMQNKKSVVIEDIFVDDRIPKDAYSPTFVKSLAMVPININEPIGAIGNYWKETYAPTEIEMQLLQTLADATARAIENIQLYSELEDRVKRRTDELNAANIELETFTYSVSHDLKAPLRGIDGYSKLLLDEYGNSLNEEATRFIQNIRSSTLQMNRLIEDLLSYSRLERSHFKQEKIALKSFSETLVSNFSEEIRKGRFEVKINIPEVEIVTDSTGLSIILRNFIENAIKFTREKQNPNLEINFSENPENWIIAVKDNGAGFDMKYHDRIFEIFQRLHRAEDFPGTGIGLAMVAKAAQRMNGKTRAESIPGKGSVFFIEIPKNNSI